MSLKAWIKNYAGRLGVEARTWGRTGADVRACMEKELGIQFSGDIGEFVESVGNVSLGPFMIAVTGDDQGCMSAVSETAALRSVFKDLPCNYVKIMEHAGETYFFDAIAGHIYAFDSSAFFPSMKTLAFDSFLKFLTWTLDEAKSQELDKRFGVLPRNDSDSSS